MAKINVKGKDVSFYRFNDDDYICITDIAKYKNADAPADIVKNWLRNRTTIEFLGIWEKLYNPEFKLVEFDQFRRRAGLNSFVLSPQKWIETTNSIGLKSKSGRYGGTYAHKEAKHGQAEGFNEVSEKIGQLKMIYEQKGYPKDWVEKRVRGIAVWNELTDERSQRGDKQGRDYAILTN
jgi:hypothetical protein